MSSQSATIFHKPSPVRNETVSSLNAWMMVGVAAVAMVATLPGRTHGLGMITERLIADEELGLTRSLYGQINLWATLIGSLFCLGIGSLVDRYGIRVMLTVVMGLLSVAVISMSYVASFWMLFVGILLTRGFGQSALSVISITIIGKWFDKNVSLPMAVYSVLMAGGFIAAALIGREYANVDWRVFWSALGWIVAGATVLLFLVARDRRVSKSSPTGVEADEGNPNENSFTTTQALKTPIFWICSLAISLYGMIASGISLFNESILVDRGFSKEVYYESLAMGTGIGVLSKLIAGWLGLYWSVNRLLGISMLILAISLAWLTQIRTYADVVVYVLLSAISGGALTVLFFSAYPQLFGRAHLGKIQGLAQMMTVVASAFGPLAFAEVREWTQSYEPLLWTLFFAVVATGVLSWFAPLPVQASHRVGAEST